MHGVYDHEDFLLGLRNYDTINEPDFPVFFNRIISKGKQPRMYNKLIPHISESESLALLSISMPLMFYYNELTHTNGANPDVIYRLIHEDVDIINEPAPFGQDFGSNSIQNPPPVDLETDAVVGFTMLFSDLYHDENCVFTRYRTNLVVFKFDNNTLKHVGTFHFNTSEGKKLISITYHTQNHGFT